MPSLPGPRIPLRQWPERRLRTEHRIPLWCGLVLLAACLLAPPDHPADWMMPILLIAFFEVGALLTWWLCRRELRRRERLNAPVKSRPEH